MIRLVRAPKPDVLVRRAEDATATLVRAWSRGENLEIDEDLYGHVQVKTTLRATQHDKCVYCETRDARSPGAVEHFRPKNGWRQRKGGPLNRPGYFWLAYEWKNLYFACTMCNDAGHKGNCFPLANPRARASPSQPDYRREIPLLLNPYGRTELGLHLTWDSYIPRAFRGSRRGKATIDVFGLDSDRLLIDRRRDFLGLSTLVLDFAERLPKGSKNRKVIHEVLLKRLDGTEEYTAMIEANLGGRIRAL